MATKKRKSAYTPPPSEITSKRARPADARRTRTIPKQQRQQQNSRVRAPKPPTWAGQFKMAPIFFALFMAVQYLLPAKTNEAKTAMEILVANAGVGLTMTAVFLPIDYMLKRNRYNSYMRRMVKASNQKSAKVVSTQKADDTSADE